MDKNNKIISFFLIIFFSSILNVDFVFAEELNHIVISEIQIGGETANDEFVKLYNPTNENVDLADWDLKRKTKTGTESNILNNIEGTILAKGVFLIAPRANCGEGKNEDCYQGVLNPDDEYTTNSYLAKDNTVLLYNANGGVVDKVGWGGAGDFEGEVIINPENGQSLIRKMNGEVVQDSNNNQNDFLVQGDSLQDVSVQENEVNDGQLGSTQEHGAKDEEIEDNKENLEGIKETHPNPSQEGNKIMITEFLPNPEDSDRDNEFIELYNKEEEDVDLVGWTLEDKEGKTKVFTISEKNIIKAKSYKVFYSDKTRITLNNSGDGIILKDNQGNIISETLLSGSAKEDQSYALDENGNWSWTLILTPEKENIIQIEKKKISEKEVTTEEKKIVKKEKESNYNFSDQIIISEIFPNPRGRDNTDGLYEWIELYNDSDQDVNLNGWQLDDILNKGSNAYTFEDIIIKAGDYLLLSNETTKLILNNSGDEVNLLWADGSVVEKISYEKSQEGASYGISFEENWSWSKDITPGKENKTQRVIVENKTTAEKIEDDNVENIENQDYLIEKSYIDAEIQNLNHFMRFTRVKISGTVSTPPGVFADEVLYLAGSEAGIQVFYKKGEYPKIQIGDFIEVIGLLSEIGGERRILLSSTEDIKIISSDNFVKPQIVSTGAINQDTEGRLVIVEGKISRIKEDVFFVDDGSGEVKVYIKPQTNIKKDSLHEGDLIVVAGQVSRTSLGYRILPRFQNDIKRSLVSGISNIAEASSNLNVEKKVLQENKKFPFFSLLVMTGTLILIDWSRMKIKRT